MKKLVKFLNDILTEPDGRTTCPIRVIALLGIIQGLGTEAYTVFIQHAAFDLQSFGVGLGTIIATFGVALGMKKDSPEDKS